MIAPTLPPILKTLFMENFIYSRTMVVANRHVIRLHFDPLDAKSPFLLAVIMVHIDVLRESCYYGPY